MQNHDALTALKTWFPALEPATWERLEAWAALFRDWNSQINLVSRKDIDNLEIRHLAHCLAITPHLKLMDGSRVLDVGTGGGLPGLVLAIVYPNARFLCVDSIGKKVRVVEDLAAKLNVRNCEVRQCRAETLTREFDFVLGRAVTSLDAFIPWVFRRVRPGRKNSLENGLLYWKGGGIEPGIEPTRVFDLQKLLGHQAFEGKFILHLRQPALLHTGRRLASLGQP